MFRSLKYKQFFRGFRWPNIKKAFFGENLRNFLILELESSISRNIRNFFGGCFFIFSSLGLKSAPGGYFLQSVPS